MVPENEAVVRRFFEELWNAGDLDAADALLSPAHVHHIGERQLDGPDGVKDAVTNFRGGFPDLHFAIEEVVSDGDRVVVRWIATGTQTGPFYDLPATGRPARWSGMDLVRLEGGRIVELWANADSMTLFEQLTDEA
jgi:steroid delta-isomerase-like uncharacterized protein